MIDIARDTTIEWPEAMFTIMCEAWSCLTSARALAITWRNFFSNWARCNNLPPVDIQLVPWCNPCNPNCASLEMAIIHNQHVHHEGSAKYMFRGTTFTVCIQYPSPQQWSSQPSLQRGAPSNKCSGRWLDHISIFSPQLLTVPTISGTIDKSATLRFVTPYTFSRASTTPLSALDFMAQVPSCTYRDKVPRVEVWQFKLYVPSAIPFALGFDQYVTVRKNTFRTYCCHGEIVRSLRHLLQCR